MTICSGRSPCRHEAATALCRPRAHRQRRTHAAQLDKRPGTVLCLTKLRQRLITLFPGAAAGITAPMFDARARGGHLVHTRLVLSNQAEYGPLGLAPSPLSRPAQVIDDPPRICAVHSLYRHADTNHSVGETVSVPLQAITLGRCSRGSRPRPPMSPPGSQPTISGDDSVSIEIGEGARVIQ